MRPVTLPDEAVVIRFTPVEPASVLRKAAIEHRRIGSYGVSVFADVPRSGEDRQAVIRRLLEVAKLDGVDPARNKKLYVCAEAAELRVRGFTFYKYEDHEEPAEMPEHYSVDLGSVEPVPTEGAAVSFLGAFDPQRWTS